MTSTVNYLIQKITNLEKISEIKNSKIQKITPVFKWAQSKSKIFINVKFAHRWDSPGCLDLWNLNFEIINKKKIKFEAFGIQGEQPLKFLLEFPLLREVKSGSFKQESVGTAVITLEKEAENKVWRNLVERNWVKENFKNGFKEKLWWEMNKRFPDAQRAYDMMIKKEEEFLDKVRFFFKMLFLETLGEEEKEN